MKKRILGLVLALCLIAGLLPMTAFAETKPDVTVSLRSGGSYNLSTAITPGTTKFYTTDADKKLVAWEGAANPTDSDSYLKLDYPTEGDKAIVYVTLNNIEIVDTTSAFDPGKNDTICFRSGEYAAVVTLQGTNTITNSNNAGIYSEAANGTTITGTGSLFLKSSAAPGSILLRNGELLIKDTTLKFEHTSTSWRHCILADIPTATSTNIRIEGSTIDATTKTGSLVFFGNKTGSGSNKYHGAGSGDSNSARTLTITESTITAATASGANVFNTTSVPAIVRYSNITISNSASSKRLFKGTPDFGPEGTYDAVVAAEATGENPVPYAGTFEGYKYLKITNNYTPAEPVSFRLNNLAGEGKSPSISETISPSATPLYYTTNDSKEFVAWTGAEAPTDNDKYIKVSYPVAAEPVVYVTLNKIDAVNTATGYGDKYSNIHFVEGAYALHITLQGANILETGGGANIHSEAIKGTTITGSGSLAMTSASAPGCITARRGDLLIKDTTLEFTNAGTSWRHAILLDAFDGTEVKGGSNNLVIEGSTITATTKTGGLVFFGKMAGTAANGAGTTDASVSTRTAIFKNSTITAITGTGGSVFRTPTTPVFEYCNLLASCSTSSQRLFRVAPSFTGMTMLGGEYADGRDAAEWDAENYGKYRYINATHTCAAAADDGDCTTADLCACGKTVGTAQTAHVAGADDGDCTTATMCGNAGCTKVFAPAPATAHVAGADDGDCTTGIKCTNTGCTKDAVAAKAAHTPKAGTYACDVAHPCAECTKNYREAGTHTGGTATCQEKAKCASCGTAYGELAACKPDADDGDCTTAIKCSVCKKELTAAKEAHKYTDNADTTCDNAGCTNTRKVEAGGTGGNPQTADNTALVLVIALTLASAAAIAGVSVLNKRRYTA